MLLQRPLVATGFLYRRNTDGYRASLFSSPQRRTTSAFEARVSLLLALTSQASSVSLRRNMLTSFHLQWIFYLCFCCLKQILIPGLVDLASETSKYAFPRRFESSNLEEALMSGTHASFSFPRLRVCLAFDMPLGIMFVFLISF